MRHARDHSKAEDDHRCGEQGHGLEGQLLGELPADGFVCSRLGDEDACRGRDDQRRDLRDQTVADSQGGVDGERLGERHLVLEDSDDDTAYDVYEGDDDACYGISPHELRGSVHGPVELRLTAYEVAPLAGLLLGDHARIEVGVDGHLLAGHGVQGESCGHFADARGALGDDHEVDDHENGEHHEPDHVASADHELAKCVDHPARRQLALGAVQQDQPRRCDVECQAVEGHHQKQRREHREVQGIDGVHAHHQRDDADGDAEGEKDVQEKRGQRDEYDDHDHHDPEGHDDITGDFPVEIEWEL